MTNGKTVLVTGASGHVGPNLVRALAERGYRVRASVRDANDPQKAGPARVAGAAEIVSLDVRDADRFAEASRDIDTLYHVAATYKYYTRGKAEDEAMIRDSIDGATAAIRAAANNRICRVVLTSSAVTLPVVEPGGRATTEADWRTDLAMPYFRAKTLAEKEAWRLAKDLGVDLVTVLPGAIIGPGFSRSTPSTDAILGIMLGSVKMGAPKANIPLVDVRDVVSGHILAGESGLGGRFVICNDKLPYLAEVAQVMNRIDPSVPAAPRTLPDFALNFAAFFDWLNSKTLGTPRLMTGEFIASVRGREWTMSNARAKAELGWHQAIPLEQSLADTMAALREMRARPKTAPTDGVAEAPARSA